MSHLPPVSLDTHPTHLQLVPDRVAVRVQVEDQGLLLVHGAGLRGGAARTEAVLHLHTEQQQHEAHAKNTSTVTPAALCSHASVWKGIFSTGRETTRASCGVPGR